MAKKYIDAEAAVNEIFKLSPKEDADGYHCWVTRSAAARSIDSIPAADVVEVQHAHWRDTGSGQECSLCKEIQYGYDNGRRYCQNCGAKMDKETKT